MRKPSMVMRIVPLFMAASILLTSCASTTLIQSRPSGAKIYLNDEPVGTTPYSHTDTKITGSTTFVKLELDGFETLNTSFSRNEEADVGAIIGGIFFLVPFLWTMKYKPLRTYELSSLTDIEISAKQSQAQLIPIKSKAERLRELKQLLDEEVITQEEYDKEKKKILEED